MTMKTNIFRASKRDELYVYLKEGMTPDELPVALQEATGELEFAMQLELHDERKLARADVKQVMASLEDQGFYVQMPPPSDL